MSVHVLSDHPSRRAATRAQGGRRTRRKGAATGTPTRDDLKVDFVSLCEVDPAVEALQVPDGPALIDIGEEFVEHMADFEIVRDGVAYLVDVVPDADLIHHPLRTALITGAVADDGRPLVIETTSSLRAEPRYTTVRLVQECRRTPVSAGDRVRILHHLDETGTAPLIECASVVQNTRDGVAAVLALAVEGLVVMDIEQPILPETPVRRRKLTQADF
jgi:hypothetical protein